MTSSSQKDESGGGEILTKRLTPEQLKKLEQEYEEAKKILDADKLWDKKPSVVTYDGEFIKVVEIPIVGTKPAWSIVDLLVAKGFTVKAVIEQEYWKTSLVVLERRNSSK